MGVLRSSTEGSLPGLPKATAGLSLLEGGAPRLTMPRRRRSSRRMVRTTRARMASRGIRMELIDWNLGGVRPRDEGVRPGDEGVRPGDEGVRPGEGCSSPSYSPPESPSLLEEVEPSQNLWGRGEKEKVAVERVEEEEEDMFADSEEINKETSAKQVEEVKVVKSVRVVKSVVGNKTSDRSAKTRDLSEVQPLVKKRFHKRVNASHRASLEYDPRAMDMTSSQEVVVREVARSQGKMARSQGEVARSQGKVTRSQGEVVRQVAA